MRIGDLELENSIFLAPMAGITDQPFRQLCLRFGAGLTFSEMIWANPKVQNTEKSRLRIQGVKRKNMTACFGGDLDTKGVKTVINAVQIAGSCPMEMAQTARLNVERGANLIDINMGCPAKKVNRKLAGSALLQHPKLVEEILKAVVSAVDVPVSLKIRTGWNSNHINCLEIAKIAEQSGVKALTIHGRTRACLFNGKAEYDNIKRVKANLSIPVVANGDIQNGEDALKVLDYCNADGVMIGRASLGNPWIFQDIVAKLNPEKTVRYLSLEEKYQIILQHIHDIHSFYGEEKGFRIARKHIGWYFDHLNVNVELKQQINRINNPKTQLSVLENIFNS